MVKSRHRGSNSEESEEDVRHKHKKHKHRHKSQHHSEQESHRYRSRSESRSPSHHRHRVKPDPDHDGSRNDRKHHRHGEARRQESTYDPHRRIKREPVDDLHEQQGERQRNDDRRRENRQRQRNNPEGEFNFGRGDHSGANREEATESKPKDKPNFELSGKLTEDTNTYKGVVIKYNEPPEARKPRKRWRLYPFKNDEPLPVLHIHRQSAYLLGRERLIADIPIDHPSCSKQHAVLQFRMVDKIREDGTRGRRVAPYIIDLDSANGTFVNNKKIEPQRYVELLEKDVVKFGFSSREYVLLHDASKTDEDEGASD